MIIFLVILLWLFVAEEIFENFHTDARINDLNKRITQLEKEKEDAKNSIETE